MADEEQIGTITIDDQVKGIVEMSVHLSRMTPRILPGQEDTVLSVKIGEKEK